MGSTTVKVKSVQLLNHTVLQVETEKQEGFSVNPGQAADISCGPPVMMKLVEKILSDLQIDESLIIKESL